VAVKPYRVLRRRRVLTNQRFEVYLDDLQLPAGGRVPDFLIVKPRVLDAQRVSGVCVLPEVDGRVGLMRSYRHQLGASIWQAVSGFVEKGERTRTTALREVHEETGLDTRARDLVSLGRFFPEPGLVEGALSLYVARCRHTGRAAEEEIGIGRLRFFTRAELARLLTRPDVGGSTLVACYRYLSR
jgi:8-oxo-dGTP pyrophosphatase MutT (NUDIX family)